MMDGTAGGPAPGPGSPPSENDQELPIVDPVKWEAEFKGLVADVERASHEWGVRPESLEGRFVKALLGTTAYLGRLTATAQAVCDARSKRQVDAAELEVARAREVTRAASLAVTQARNAQIALQVEQETVVARMIDKVFPMFAQRMQEVLTIREKRVNAEIMLQRYGIVALVTLGLFLGGYMVRLSQDSAATALLDRCLIQPVQSGGAFWCDISNVIPMVQSAPPKQPVQSAQ